MVTVAVAAFLCAGPAARADFLTNLEGYWALDESSPSTTAADSSVNGSDGTLSGDPTWQPAGGALNGAIDLDGSGDIVTVPWNAGAGIDILNKSFSLSFWTKRGSTGTADYAIGQGDTGSPRQSLHVGFRNATQFTFAFWSDDLNYTNAAVVGDTTNWHHWVCTYNSATGAQSVYLDGATTPVATDTAGDFTGSGSNDFWLGKRRDGNDFDGLLDEVGVWSNRVLTGTEASQLYNGGTPLYFFSSGTATSQASGDWHVAGTWSGSPAPPDSATDAIVNGGYTVTARTAQTNVGGTLEIQDVAGSTVVVDPGATLSIGGAVNAAGAGALVVNGQLDAGGGAIGAITNTVAGTPTINNSGAMTATALNLATGSNTFVKTGAGTLEITGTTNTIVPANTVRVSGGELKMQTTSTPIGGAALNLNGGTFTVEGAAAFGNSLQAGRFEDGGFQQDLSADGGSYTDTGSGIFTGQQILSGSPNTNATQTGPLLYSSEDALETFFFGAPVGGDAQTWSGMWTGYYVAQVDGVHDFFISHDNGTSGIDDDGSVWVDADQSGTFDAGEGGTTATTLTETTIALTAGQKYAVAFGFYENTGGEHYRVQFKEPAGGTYTTLTTVDPTAQAGYWQAQVSAAIDMTGTTITVTDDSGLNGISSSTVAFGPTTIDAGKTLTLGGANGGVTFTSMGLGVGSTLSSGIDYSVPTLTFAGSGTLDQTAGTGTAVSLSVPAGQTVTKSGSGTFEVTGTTALATGQIFDVTAGTLTLSGVVSGDALTKNGGGTMLLTANNTYTGVTTVNAGILSITNGGALGDTAGGTVVSGGQLRLGVNNITVDSGESISIAGDGPSSGGAIYAQAGGNMNIDGPVSLAENSLINVAAGASARLRLRGGLALNDKNLRVIVAGSGERFEINTTAMTGSGDLTLEGNGITELKVANPGYTGEITVNAGYLSITDGGALGDTGGGTVINSGAQLRLDTNNITVDSDESISIAGTGPGNGGAIYAQAGGNMNIDGPVSLAADSLINIAPGASARLRLRGGLALNDKNLTANLAGSGERLEITVPIAGSGNMTLQGNGRTELKVANPGFTGAMNLTSGSMDAVAGALSGTSAVTVSAGASLDVAGGLMNNLTVNGDATTSANMTIINNLTVSSTSLQAGANVVTIGTGATMNLGSAKYTVDSGNVGVSGTVSATKPEALTLNGNVTVTTPGVPTGQPTGGLLGMWTFDDGTATDLTGNGHDGSIVGSPTFGDTDTPYGSGTGLQSLNTNGGNNAILIGGNEADFDTGDQLTVVAWVKERPDDDWEPWISKRGESNQGWQVRRHTSHSDMAFTLRGTPQHDDNPHGTFNIGDNNGSAGWFHLVARFDGTTNQLKQLIVNGNTASPDISAAQTGNIANTGSSVVFGARDNSGNAGNPADIGNWAHIKLDDVFIYDRWLTDAEVATIYNGGAALPRAATAALVGSLSGAGTIDASGSGGIEVTGDLAPGNSVGQIDITGDLAFADDSSYTVSVDGTDADLVTVDGDVTIGTDVLLAIDGTPTADSYDILTYTGSLAGTFDDTQVLLQGYQVTYAPGVVSITPEPGTMALLGLGGAVILVRRRRRA